MATCRAALSDTSQAPGLRVLAVEVVEQVQLQLDELATVRGRVAMVLEDPVDVGKQVDVEAGVAVARRRYGRFWHGALPPCPAPGSFARRPGHFRF